jgi:hypothetical protein
MTTRIRKCSGRTKEKGATQEDGPLHNAPEGALCVDYYYWIFSVYECANVPA